MYFLYVQHLLRFLNLFPIIIQGNCFAIVLPPWDPIWSEQGCLEFTRSEAFCEGKTPVRENINVDTSYVDASNVYGSSEWFAK